MGKKLFWVSLLALLVMILLAVASGQQWLPQRIALLGIALMGLTQVVVFLLSIWAWLRRGKTNAPLKPIVLTLLVAGSITAWNVTLVRQGMSVPPIHDITTDTDNPPQFIALKTARDAAPNGSAYNPAIADQQKTAYPDIAPVMSSLPPADVIAAMEGIMAGYGWTVISDTVNHRLEATSITPLMGFVDDVIIRVTPIDGGSRIDMRSMSRLGQSDLGANAKRLRGLRESFCAESGANCR